MDDYRRLQQDNQAIKEEKVSLLHKVFLAYNEMERLKLLVVAKEDAEKQLQLQIHQLKTRQEQYEVDYATLENANKQLKNALRQERDKLKQQEN